MKPVSLDDLYYSATAVAAGIINLPPVADRHRVNESLIALRDHVLQPVQEHVDVPLIITSGYRTQLINVKVGGTPTSQHLEGQAADFTLPGYHPGDYRKLGIWISETLDVDQLIVYPKRLFIHVSYRSALENRHQVIIKP